MYRCAVATRPVHCYQHVAGLSILVKVVSLAQPFLLSNHLLNERKPVYEKERCIYKQGDLLGA